MKSRESFFFVVCAVAAGALASGLGGCASKPLNPAPLRPKTDAYERVRKDLLQGDRIAPGNVLAIDYAGDPAVSGRYKVDIDGRLQLPYQVVLKAAGLRASQLRDEVQERYRAFVKGAFPTRVEIKDRSVWIEVRGEIKNPGRYLVRPDMPLEEIIAKGGGFAAERPDFLRIERPEVAAAGAKSSWYQLADYFLRYDTEPDFLWRGGETLFFQMTAPENVDINRAWNTITVMGEVREPKEHPVLPHADLLTYISRSGGPSTAADLSRVEIIRRFDGGSRVASLTASHAGEDLRGGDVVLVHAIDNSPTFFDKALSYAATVSTITLAVIAIILL